MRKIVTALLLIVFLFISNSFALVLDGRQNSYDDFDMKSAQGIETIDDALKSKDFKTTKNNFTLGYIFDTVWFEVDVKNGSQEAKEYFLEFSEPFAHESDFYVFGRDGMQKIENGLHVPILQRTLQTHLPTVKLHFEPQETKKIYIKYSCRFSSYGSFAFYAVDEFYKKNILYASFYFFYFGAIVIMALYNLFLYIALRDSGYIYYVGYVLTFAVWVFLYSGFSLYFIDAKLHYMLHFTTSFSFVFLSLFTKKILHLKDNFPLLNKLLNLFTVLLVSVSAWVVFDLEIGYLLTNIIGLLYFPLLVVLALLSVQKNVKAAKFYLFSLLLFLLSMMLTASTGIGLLPVNNISRYSFVIGSMVEITLFSLLLAYRINLLRQEKFQTQAALLELTNSETQRLQQMVNEKIADLNSANVSLKKIVAEKELLLKEVYHRVKNNLQMIIALLGLQQSKTDDQQIKKCFSDSQNRIRSIALAHELLYSSQNLSEISSTDYFRKLLDAVINMIDWRNIEIKTYIEDLKLDIDTAVSLGIIIAEVISNCAEHAFEGCDKPLVNVRFKSENGKKILFIKDNGIGFDGCESTKDGTLGLKLIRQMSNKLSHCTIRFRNIKGTLFVLEFKTDE